MDPAAVRASLVAGSNWREDIRPAARRPRTWHRIPSPPTLAVWVVAILVGLPVLALAQSGISGRPIIFVPGIREDAAAWNGTLVADGLAADLNAVHPDLYPETGRLEVFCDFNETAEDRMVKVKLPEHPDQWAPLLEHPELENRRFFAISFYDPVIQSFDPVAIAGRSIINKAAELSRIIRAISRLTRVKDVVVVAHSMGGLVARAYLEDLLSSTPCGSLYACLRPQFRDPDQDRYTSDVGALLTIDTPHVGASLANGLLALFPEFLNTVNYNELKTTSDLVRALNYEPGILLDGVASAHDLPPSLPIESLISSYSDLPCGVNYCDGIVLSYEQSVRLAIPQAKRTTDVVDRGNSFASDDLSFACSHPPLGWLHQLSCVGQQDQTRNHVLHFVSTRLVGALTQVTVSATIGGGVPWTEPVSFAMTGPAGASAQGSS